MNAPFLSPVCSQTPVERFDTLRLQIIDAFYELDVALEEWINDGGASCPNASTGCRVDRLASLEFSAEIATAAQSKRFKALPEELSETIHARNFVIHSRAEFGVKSDKPVIFLSPVGYRYGRNDLFVHTTFEEVVGAIHKAKIVARSLTGWRNQRLAKYLGEDAKASSPPPPSPAAADGP